MGKKLVNNRSPNWAFMEKFEVPHYDNPDQNYLWRLRIIQTPWFGIYLHKLETPDPRDTLHDHPWSFVSLVLKGGYTEFVPGPPGEYAVPKKVNWINVKRFGRDFHWISELDRTPTWTLMFVGRRRKVWGYLEKDGTYTPFNEHHFNDDFEKAMSVRYGES